MNISFKMSKKIHVIEKKINKKNLLNSKYLIIKRECADSGLGLFAYYVTMLSRIEYALSHKMIPVIDMKNYANTFHGKDEVGRINTWELFYEQPCNVSLEEALKTGNARYIWNDIPKFHPNDSLDFLYNDEVVKYYHDIAQKYIRFNSKVLELLKKKEEDIFGRKEVRKRILGVLARGTDYTGLRPYYNPIQPSVKQLIDQIDKYCEEYNCEKIYIATEDTNILKQFKDNYGDRLLYTDQKRVTNVSTYLYENKEFVIDRNPFERGIEYLCSIYLLSKCNGLVAGRTTGTVGTCIMADNYEFKYIFSLGRYGVEDNIIGRLQV